MKLLKRIYRWNGMLVLLSLVLLTGCIESNDHYILNPDGSGKLIHDVKFVMVDLNMGGREKTSEEKAKTAVEKLISDSKGIDAWQDVSFSMEPDGRIAFKGTAYFPDISKIALKHGGSKLEMLTPDYRSENGKSVLEINWSDEKKSSDEAANSGAADVSQLTAERAKYQQMKPMMAAMFGNLKLNQKFTLPAAVTSATNMTQEGNSVSILLQGSQMMKVIDGFISDDEWLLQQLSSGKSMGKDFSPDDSLNQKLFGTSGPIRASTADVGTAQFDYVKEMEAAKAAMPAMLQQLGFSGSAVVTQMQPPSQGEGFTKVVVGGLRVVHDVGNNNIRPFNWSEGLSVSLTGTFAGSVMDVKEGEITHAESLAGENLLAENEFDRRISFPNLSEDGSMVTYEVKLNAPQNGSRGIKRLAGTLEYWTSTATRDVDLGLTSLATGTKSTELGGMVGEYSETNWGDKTNYQVVLDLEVSVSQIKEIKVYDSSGKWIESIKQSGYSGFDQSVSMNLSSQEPFPKQGNIIVTLYDDIKKFTIPFEVGPFDWLGQPITE